MARMSGQNASEEKAQNQLKIMAKRNYFNRLMQSGTFRFEKLVLQGIDNEPVLRVNYPRMAEEEICLFHRNVDNGDQYFRMMHQTIQNGLKARKGIPVVRFADGEYAFYRYSLKCNGLYQQAESRLAIKKAMPAHIEALRILTQSGMFASLVFPGNTQVEDKRFFSFWRRAKMDSSAITFLDFLFSHGIELEQNNYLPFYVVYAYLTSELFAGLVDKKNVCLINSECQMDSCRQWFARFTSHPALTFVDIPNSYVATQWSSIKEKVLNRIPPKTELCLVGAGVGTLLVCVDIAGRFSIPAIDTGHVLNMMNGREDKSKGPRMYTLWKTPENKNYE